MSIQTRQLLLCLLGVSFLFGSSVNASLLRDDESYQPTLATSDFAIGLMLELNASAGAVLQPVSLAPDVWYGASERLTVGVVHSGLGQTGFFGTTGNGFCFTGTSNGCTKLYDSFGISSRYSLYSKSFGRLGAIGLASEVGLFTRTLESFNLASKVGFALIWERGRLQLTAAPSVWLGTIQRNATNPDQLFVPASAHFVVSNRIRAGVQFGYAAELNYAKQSRFPLSAGIDFGLNERVQFTFVFSFPELAGKQSAGTRSRSLTFGTMLAF